MKENDRCSQWFRRGSDDGMFTNGECVQHGKSHGTGWSSVPANGGTARYGSRFPEMTDGVVVPVKSGNADGGKDPWSWNSVLKERAAR